MGRVMRNLVSGSKVVRFAFRYGANLDNKFMRAAIAATDGPAFYKRRLWRRYLTADPAFQSIPLNDEFQQYLQTLREHGIVTIEGVFTEAAARLREMLGQMELLDYRRSDSVTDFEIDIGYTVPEVVQMLSHPQLCGLFCNYYGRQAYYREHPIVMGMSGGVAGVDRSSSHVHCDGYRQLTLHFLLNDVSPADSHLIYYAGTHKQPKLDYERVTANLNRVEGCQQVLGTGRAGTLTIFDSGSGYHRGEYTAGQRVFLTQVVTTGWLPFRDPQREDRDVMRVVGERQAPHARAMFERR